MKQNKAPQLTVALLVLIDGLFHLLSSLETFMRFAPDWVVSDGMGFGVNFHRVMGFFLVASSLIAIGITLKFIEESSELFGKIYYWLVAPITLGLIALALLKTIVGF